MKKHSKKIALLFSLILVSAVMLTTFMFTTKEEERQDSRAPAGISRALEDEATTDVSADVPMSFANVNDKIVAAFDKELAKLYGGDCKTYGTAKDLRSASRRYKCGEVPLGKVQYKTAPLANGSKDVSNQKNDKYVFQLDIPAFYKPGKKYKVTSQALTIPFTLSRSQLSASTNVPDLAVKDLKTHYISKVFGNDIYLRHIPGGDTLKTLACVDLPGLKLSSPASILKMKAKKKVTFGWSTANIKAQISASYYSFGGLHVCSEIQTAFRSSTGRDGNLEFTPVVTVTKVFKPKILAPKFSGLKVLDVDAKVNGFYGFISSVVGVFGTDIEGAIETSVKAALEKELAKRTDVTTQDIRSGRWLTSYVEDVLGDKFGLIKVNGILTKAISSGGAGEQADLADFIYDQCAATVLAAVPHPTSAQQAQARASCHQMIISFDWIPFYKDAEMNQNGCYSYYSTARAKSGWWRKQWSAGATATQSCA